jgi:hypothetical protein
MHTQGREKCIFPLYEYDLEKLEKRLVANAIKGFPNILSNHLQPKKVIRVTFKTPNFALVALRQRFLKRKYAKMM